MVVILGGTLEAQTETLSTEPPPGISILMAAEQAVQGAIERAAPSVVAIARVRRQGARDVASELNFNLPGLPPLPLRVSDWLPVTGSIAELGSGVILSKDGVVLTCFHLLDDPEKHDYFVWIAEPRTPGSALVPRQAQVLAGDPWSDLAVLKIEADNLPEIVLGDATGVKPGAFVVALGNPYAGIVDGRASASWGIISNLQRRAPPLRESDVGGMPSGPSSLQEYPTLLQTDAKLSLGTSGGALVNLRGEMIGLTTSIAAVAGFEQAAGYAIAIDPPTVATISRQREGRLPAFGFLGVEPMDADGRGALVRNVVPGLSADNAGIRTGELIVEVEGRSITNAVDLFLEMSRRPADSSVKVTLVGVGGQRREVSVLLGKKRLALSKPGYSLIEEPNWRGLSVDFASVLPPDRLFDPRGGDREVRRPTAAAIVRVDPDSPAWIAGIRPGRIVVRVGEVAVERPEDFFRIVEGANGNVTLWLERRGGGSEPIVVGADAQEDEIQEADVPPTAIR